ncbi:MAG: zinc ribbon domain-containing protein [Chloroflexaceae bacterium]|nr:zinc ribbon domain-containing protein [Chloroflexaceae bacterium]NJO04838.1 zinc ribbon domain-containing protein [Chloroflexaceae bacterium]
MVERICSQCQHGNPLDNRYCGRCGAPIDQPQTARRQETALTLSRPQLPAELKQIGTTVALSLVTLAAEAGLAWLRGRVERIGSEPLPRPQAAPTRQMVRAAPAAHPDTSDVETIMSQRIVQIWDEGSLTRQIVERTIWQRQR